MQMLKQLIYFWSFLVHQTTERVAVTCLNTCSEPCWRAALALKAGVTEKITGLQQFFPVIKLK